ncbi:prephenate dehydrogenase/arogenate dehydrogenase family protein [Thermodesulfobacteriota bacterium]
MGLSHPTVGIVGGTGRMGGWLTGLLKGCGLTVLASGRKTELNPSEMARQCDVVVISVPIADTERVIKEIGPLVREDGLLMDLASVKKGPVEAMLKYSKSQVVGVHPLFGPDAVPNGSLGVAICRGRGEDGLNWIASLFKDEGYKVTFIDPEAHDRMMGLIQGVNHFSTLAFALTISRSGFDLEELADFSTQTFIERLDRIKSIIEQQSDLFSSLLLDNPAADEFIKLHMEAMENLIRIMMNGDREAFEGLFKSLKTYFGASRL